MTLLLQRRSIVLCKRPFYQ